MLTDGTRECVEPTGFIFDTGAPTTIHPRPCRAAVRDSLGGQPRLTVTCRIACFDTVRSRTVGSAGSVGNFANYNYAASWNTQTGNVTTVGTNGGSSAYDAFDMSGNVLEWDDLNGTPGPTHGLRGGYYGYYTQPPLNLGSTDHYEGAPSLEYPGVGFRLAATSVPEIDPTRIGGVLAVVLGSLGLLERRRQRAA